MHFGLLELAEGEPNRYGGLGLMLESPALRLRWQPDDHPLRVVAASTVEIQRRIQLAQSHALSVWAARHGSAVQEMPGTIEVLECPPMHSGLGVGTQLGTAVAQLTALALQTQPSHLTGTMTAVSDLAELAWLSGRGKRSAIGLHGFLHGGLVRDLGYVSDNDASQGSAPRPLQTHSVTVPVDWTVVLCSSGASGDVHGPLEDQLIHRAAAHANPNRTRMLTLSEMALQAATSDDFAGFVQVLDEYMELASRLFATVQAGRYRDMHTAARVEEMRAVGLCGVGQSSWGPTVFGFAPNAERAEIACDQLAQRLDSRNVRILITRPKASGAHWSMNSASGKQHAG